MFESTADLMFICLNDEMQVPASGAHCLPGSRQSRSRLSSLPGGGGGGGAGGGGAGRGGEGISQALEQVRAQLLVQQGGTLCPAAQRGVRAAGWESECDAAVCSAGCGPGRSPFPSATYRLAGHRHT